MKGNIIQQKTHAFALKIAFFCKLLLDERKEFVLSKQLLRAGMSI
ncbi:MAG: four helix bundle protein [Chitinophagales bacterium]|jgi:four helix bundle protein